MAADRHEISHLLAFCRANDLPPPEGNRVFLHKDGVDLLLIADGGEHGMTLWADLGKVADFRNEQSLLSHVLELSSQLNPAHGVFIGLDARSGRIMLRAAFPMKANGDGCAALSGFIGATAAKVGEIKISLHAASASEGNVAGHFRP